MRGVRSENRGQNCSTKIEEEEEEEDENKGEEQEKEEIGRTGTTDAMLTNVCCCNCEAACGSSGQQDVVQMLLYD